MGRVGTGHASEPGPIFLAGADRTGIGLLGEILERHPHIAMTRRTDYWDRFADRFGDLRDPRHLARCLDALARDRRTRVFSPDRDRLVADLTGDPSYARLFELLQRQRMARLGRTRWGDKSLGAEHHAGSILQSYPSAVMIHVVRDPRDRYASQKFHRQAGRGNAGVGVAQWRSSVRRAERNARRYPGRYLVVRYESLVGDPTGTLRAVCSFLGEPCPAPFLEELGPSRSMVPGRDEGPGTLHRRSIGRFRTDLSPGEVATVQVLTRRRSARLGYDPRPVRVDGLARLRLLAVQLPTDAVRMLLWEAVDPLRRRLVRPRARESLSPPGQPEPARRLVRPGR